MVTVVAAPADPIGRPVANTTGPLAVSIRQLRKAYGDTEVVKGIDLDVRPGTFVSILGPSGSGKTTVLRSIAGLEHPSGGAIDLAGRSVFDADAGRDESIAVRHVGMIFQNYALWPHKTVLQHVLYPLGRGVGKVPRSARAKRARETLEAVGLTGLEGRYPFELSGGQQQRVAVARAVAARPPLLLMDEPLSNLDTQLRHKLRRELRSVHDATGATSIYVTHDQEEALALSDHVVLMHEGSIVQQGPPTDVYQRPATEFAATFLGFDNILPADALSPLQKLTDSSSKVAFRKEAIRVDVHADSRDNTDNRDTRTPVLDLGQWAVVEVEFTGIQINLRAELHDLTITAGIPVTSTSDLARTATLVPGAVVDLAISPGDVVGIA